MASREQAAFVAGIETARQMALTAAVTIEVREDGAAVRQQAAAVALQGLAAGLHAAFLDASEATVPPVVLSER
ncbi:hypothetical protein MKK82_24455 [Methylobacterium sp. E-046]|nr:hypothetical protein [Methylobacterium sp. E-046]